jgi:hypothetical protein
VFIELDVMFNGDSAAIWPVDLVSMSAVVIKANPSSNF